jgi:hypothetical protein
VLQKQEQAPKCGSKEREKIFTCVQKIIIHFWIYVSMYRYNVMWGIGSLLFNYPNTARFIHFSLQVMFKIFFNNKYLVVYA